VCTDRFLLYRPGISRKGIATPLAHTLWEHGLIDELRLSIHPVLAGRGQRLFWESGKTPLKLDSVTTPGTGVVVLSYQPVKA
jgi:dihydrofolate reductase